MHSSVCLESETAEAEPSSRPARRCAHESTGMVARLIAASAMPTDECSGSRPVTSARTESTATKAARPKNDTATTLRARRSRRWRSWSSRAENCHATAAADVTSTTESRPNPMSAVDDAAPPAHSATTASTTL